MFSLFDIYSKNRATFRNYRTRKAGRVWPRYLTILAISLTFSLVIEIPNTNALRVIITVLGIVTGFSFSVLFFLANNGGAEKIERDDSIELDLKVERLQDLSIELFYNVSYFIVVSLISILLASIFLIFSDYSEVRPNYWLNTQSAFVEWLEYLGPIVLCVISTVLILCFWLFLCDSVSTLFRVVKRINFLFSERIEILNERSSEKEK